MILNDLLIGSLLQLNKSVIISKKTNLKSENFESFLLGNNLNFNPKLLNQEIALKADRYDFTPNFIKEKIVNLEFQINKIRNSTYSFDINYKNSRQINFFIQVEEKSIKFNLIRFNNINLDLFFNKLNSELKKENLKFKKIDQRIIKIYL